MAINFHLLLITLSVLFYMAQIWQVSNALFDEKLVVIYNLAQTIVPVHCRSLDDDLGRRNLYYGYDHAYKIIFRDNLWPYESTLVRCNTEIKGVPNINWIAYDARRHGDDCITSACTWTIRRDGLYFSRGNENERRVVIW
ncbi:hypothetical protein Tsubulata_017596 [Turnera subulata]|uniref:S-protein homolog n=1 Tax=Turnera subulata TaxID=218843 RepID=A0A9Q0J039_9ROSI|nr:hypothetical protein Tsubulata_017596 [Turnera subulata]